MEINRISDTNRVTFNNPSQRIQPRQNITPAQDMITISKDINEYSLIDNIMRLSTDINSLSPNNKLQLILYVIQFLDLCNISIDDYEGAEEELRNAVPDGMPLLLLQIPTLISLLKLLKTEYNKSEKHKTFEEWLEYYLEHIDEILEILNI